MRAIDDTRARTREHQPLDCLHWPLSHGQSIVAFAIGTRWWKYHERGERWPRQEWKQENRSRIVRICNREIANYWHCLRCHTRNHSTCSNLPPTGHGQPTSIRHIPSYNGNLSETCTFNRIFGFYRHRLMKMDGADMTATTKNQKNELNYLRSLASGTFETARNTSRPMCDQIVETNLSVFAFDVIAISGFWNDTTKNTQFEQ